MRYLPVAIAVVLVAATAVGVGVVVGVVLIDTDDGTSPAVSQASPVASPELPSGTTPEPPPEVTPEPPSGTTPEQPPGTTPEPPPGPTAVPTLEIDGLDLLATALAQTPEPQVFVGFWLLDRYTIIADPRVSAGSCGVVVWWGVLGKPGDQVEVWRKGATSVWVQIHISSKGEVDAADRFHLLAEYIDEPGYGHWTYRLAHVTSAGNKVWSDERQWAIDDFSCPN